MAIARTVRVEKDNIGRERRGKEASRPVKLETRELKLGRDRSRHPGIYTIRDQDTAYRRGLGTSTAKAARTGSRDQKLPQPQTQWTDSRRFLPGAQKRTGVAQDGDSHDCYAQIEASENIA